MKIDKILYDGGEKGWQISIAETRRTTDLLEKSEMFENGIIRLREKYKIPNECYSSENDVPRIEYLFDDKGFDLYIFFEECEDLTRNLKLPPYWYSSIAYFIMFKVFFTPEKVPLFTDIVKYKKEDALQIVVLEKMSKSELKRYIDYEWESIDEKMNLLPSANKHNMFRSEIVKRIVDMKDQEGLKFRQIADILQKEYENSELYDSLNENNIKTKYHRWKTKIKK
jgi:hypothetical protein